MINLNEHKKLHKLKRIQNKWGSKGAREGKGRFRWLVTHVDEVYANISNIYRRIRMIGLGGVEAERGQERGVTGWSTYNKKQLWVTA